LQAKVPITQQLQDAQDKEQLIAKQIKEYQQSIDDIQAQISDENMWMKSYSSYLTSLDVKKNLDVIKKELNICLNIQKQLPIKMNFLV